MGGGLFTFFDDELTAYSNKKLSRNNNCRLLASHGEHLFRSTVCVCGGGGKRKSYGFIFARFPNVMKRS